MTCAEKLDHSKPRGSQAMSLDHDDAEAVRQARSMLLQCVARQVTLDVTHYVLSTVDFLIEDRTCLYDSIAAEIMRSAQT